MENNWIVEARNVVKEYPLGKTLVRAVRGVSLGIGPGEFTAIAGPSGSGKTTLLNLIGCVDVPSGGELVVAGQRTGELTDRQLTSLRLHKLGFIFQTFNLIPVLTVRQNVEFPLLMLGSLSKKDRLSRVDALLERVGLSEHAHHRSNELSGGQRQRVAIARALVTQPPIVLADEPTANLDSETGQSILTLMHDLNRTHRTTFIFSTHDRRVMERADRVLTMRDGLLEESP